jgi:hypothetical protein
MNEKGNCEPTKRPELVELSDMFNQNLLECEELVGVVEAMFVTLNGYRTAPSPKLQDTTAVTQYNFVSDMNEKVDRLNTIRMRLNELATNLRNLVGN